MEELERRKMMEQIKLGALIRIPRLSQEEVDAYTRPRKRQAKKKYHFLSFDFLSDDEDDFFGISYPPAKKSRKNKSNVATDSNQSFDPPIEEKPTRKRKNSDLPRKDSSSNDAQRKTSCSDTQIVRIRRESKSSDKSIEKLKPMATTEVKILKIPKEEAPSYALLTKEDFESQESKYPLENIKKTEPLFSPSPYTSAANSLIGKIRIKTAAELGSTVRFIDDDNDTSITYHTPIPNNGPNSRVSHKNSSSNRSSILTKSDKAANSQVRNPNIDVQLIGDLYGKLFTSENQTKILTKSDKAANSQVRNPNIDVQLIGDLYGKLFTSENQTKIKNVAQILQNIAENIKNNNERVQEINNSKDLTDAEKLMRRCRSFQDLKRKQEENEMKLKEKFESIIEIFDNSNFELLFQLFFLGILKILIVSVSHFYKKGTIFKKLIALLQQSLSSSKFNDERVFKLLRSKDFRDRCITLVQFIEKHCRTESFSMLFLSDHDKTMIRNKNTHSSEPSNEARIASFQRHDKPEISRVQESFLLNLLKESKTTDAGSPPTTNHPHQQQQQQQQQQNTWKTYAPATKRTGTITNPASTPINPTKSNTANSNGLVNNFIFSDGQIKPYPNSHVINIHTTGPNSNASLYQMNTPSYDSNLKIHYVNGLNGTHTLSTSNGNIENIQPGSYANTNYPKFMEQYGSSNLNMNAASRGPISISRNNVWMG